MVTKKKKRSYILMFLLSHKICVPEKLLHLLTTLTKSKMKNIKINQLKILKTKRVLKYTTRISFKVHFKWF